MNIQDAINKLENVIEGFDADSQTVLRLAIKALKRSGAEYSEVSERMEYLLQNLSRIQNDTDKWAEDVYIAALAMKRRTGCVEYYKKHKKAVDKDVDGETQSMWVSIISAIIGIIATVIVGILFLFKIVDVTDIDLIAYIIAFAGWIVTIIVSIVARIINKRLVKKHDSTSEYTVAELLAVKYDKSGGIVKALLPAEMKRPSIHAARIRIDEMEFTSNPQSPNVPDIEVHDMHIGKMKL